MSKNRGRFIKMTPANRLRAVIMRSQGFTYDQISERIGCFNLTVAKYIRGVTWK